MDSFKILCFSLNRYKRLAAALIYPIPGLLYEIVL